MKTSLEHLPVGKQEQILKIVEIIKQVVTPEKIILFGSYAKGGYKDHEFISGDGTRQDYISDYDFLVVTQKNTEKTTEQESTIMDRVDRYKPPVNLEIHGIEYINEGLSWGQYFFADIIKEGILLYDSGAVQFVEPRILTANEEKEKAQRYFTLWFNRASALLKTARFNFSEEDYKIGAFILHQATECLYNTTLLVFSGYKPKTHNLGKLRKKTKVYSEEIFITFDIETNNQDKHLFDLLKRGYIEARYKDDYEISATELSELISRVSVLMENVKNACKTKIQSFETK